ARGDVPRGTFSASYGNTVICARSHGRRGRSSILRFPLNPPVPIPTARTGQCQFDSRAIFSITMKATRSAVLRVLGSAVLAAAVRALALATAALLASDVEARLWPEFLATWTAAFSLATLPLSLLELTITTSLLDSERPRDRRTIAIAAAAALASG